MERTETKLYRDKTWLICVNMMILLLAAAIISLVLQAWIWAWASGCSAMICYLLLRLVVMVVKLTNEPHEESVAKREEK